MKTLLSKQVTPSAAITVIGGALFVFYACLATSFSSNWWPKGSCGQIFNAQLLSLLDGRMDIDPYVLGKEAFIHDGLSYTYFGIWPALLRLTVLRFLHLDWTALSCALAATVATLFLLLTLRRAITASHKEWSMRVLLVAIAATLIASGPQFELTAKPTVYVEAILWGYAFACAFIWLAFPAAMGAPLALKTHLALAALAAFALQARVTTGISLYSSWSMLALSKILQPSTELPYSKLTSIARYAWPLLIGLTFAGAVNYARWGNPAEFADLSKNLFYSTDLERHARLQTHGAFELQRIPFSWLYYFSPEAFFEQKRAENGVGKIERLFDNAEGPPASQFANKIAWWCLGLLSLLHIRELRNPSNSHHLRTFALPLGLLIAPSIILSYSYLAFRFGAEFSPFAIFCAFAGISNARLPNKRLGRGALYSFLFCAAVIFLSLFQLASSWENAGRYAASDYTDGACN